MNLPVPRRTHGTARRPLGRLELACVLALAALTSCREPLGPTPVTAVAVGGNGQEITVVGRVPSQLIVRVEDASGNAVRGAPVVWSVLEGGGVVVDAVTSTDAAGEARSGWTLGATIEEQRLRARVATALDVVFNARVLPSSLEASPASARVGAGTSVHLRPVFRDAAGTTLAGRAAWEVEDVSVATVDSLGAATGLASGSTRVVAMAGTLTAYADLDVGAPATSVAGQVFTLHGAPTPGLRFHVYSDSGSFSTPVDAGGYFSFGADLSGNSVDLVVDVAEGDRVYHRSLVRASPIDLSPDLRVVMVPRSYVIGAGSLAGTTVPISLRDAFQPPCTVPNDANCDGYYPSYWRSGVALYRDVDLPVPLAFDRERSTNTVDAPDSMALWSHIEAMHSEVGRPLFRPARVEEVGLTPTGEPAAGVLIRIDNTLGSFAAWTNWWWDANWDMTRGLIRFRNTSHLGNASLVRHELMHAQGFKHTCNWDTVMGGYGCGSTESLSDGDVAFAQLAWELRTRTRQVGATHGLIAALNGELSLYGLPLVSSPLDLLPLAQPGGDEAGEKESNVDDGRAVDMQAAAEPESVQDLHLPGPSRYPRTLGKPNR